MRDVEFEGEGGVDGRGEAGTGEHASEERERQQKEMDEKNMNHLIDIQTFVSLLYQYISYHSSNKNMPT